MTYTTRRGDFGPSSDRMAPVANGVGAKLKKLVRRLTDALAVQR